MLYILNGQEQELEYTVINSNTYNMYNISIYELNRLKEIGRVSWRNIRIEKKNQNRNKSENIIKQYTETERITGRNKPNEINDKSFKNTLEQYTEKVYLLCEISYKSAKLIEFQPLYYAELQWIMNHMGYEITYEIKYVEVNIEELYKLMEKNIVLNIDKTKESNNKYIKYYIDEYKEINIKDLEEEMKNKVNNYINKSKMTGNTCSISYSINKLNGLIKLNNFEIENKEGLIVLPDYFDIIRNKAIMINKEQDLILGNKVKEIATDGITLYLKEEIKIPVTVGLIENRAISRISSGKTTALKALFGIKEKDSGISNIEELKNTVIIQR